MIQKRILKIMTLVFISLLIFVMSCGKYQKQELSWEDARLRFVRDNGRMNLSQIPDIVFTDEERNNWLRMHEFIPTANEISDGNFLQTLNLEEMPMEKKSTKKRLRRSESFFGLHFDFHAGEDCKEVGKDVTPEMVKAILDAAKPDYVQCDGKGHRGFTSYPTKLGNGAPGFVKDPLRIWRDVTMENGVALYVHYSGVLDGEAIIQHPNYAVVKSDGKTGGKNNRITSVFGDYVDELLIPQLKELNDEYGVDGAWVDGECWGTERDWGKRSQKKFIKQTGIKTLPQKPEDENWFEFSEFCRDGYRNYLNHYVTELHKHNPDFQIASNWTYSSMMPEKPTIDVDFISGDYDAKNSVNSARLEGRVMAQQGKPWDLMAWSFTNNWDIPGGVQCMKTAPQLKQEASIVLALGGGFQAYFKQKRDASIYDWTVPLMKEIAEFCRARQEYCHKANSVPQIGLILSTHATYRKLIKLFAAWNGEYDAFQGILQCVVDGNHVTDIVMEHQLEEEINRYPLLIWPEWETIDPKFHRQLIEYVKKGGNLLVIGPKAAKLFEQTLGVQLSGEVKKQRNGIEHSNWIANVESESQGIKIKGDAKPFGKYYNFWDKKETSNIAATIRKLGKGKIAGIYLNMGESYRAGLTTVSRDFLSSVINQLFPNPVVRVAGSHLVDVTLMGKDEKLLVNLINTAGPHADNSTYVFDEIPPIGPLDVSIQTKIEPKKVMLQPGNRSVDYYYENGVVSLIVPKLKIHDVIVIE